jgi:hypothetical protein
MEVSGQHPAPTAFSPSASYVYNLKNMWGMSPLNLRLAYIMLQYGDVGCAKCCGVDHTAVWGCPILAVWFLGMFGWQREVVFPWSTFTHRTTQFPSEYKPTETEE